MKIKCSNFVITSEQLTFYKIFEIVYKYNYLAIVISDGFGSKILTWVGSAIFSLGLGLEIFP